MILPASQNRLGSERCGALVEVYSVHVSCRVFWRSGYGPGIGGNANFFVMGGGLKLHSDMDMDVLIWQCHVLEPLKFL